MVRACDGTWTLDGPPARRVVALESNRTWAQRCEPWPVLGRRPAVAGRRFINSAFRSALVDAGAAAESAAGWLAGASDEVGVHQRSHSSTSVCQDHRKRLPVGDAQLLGQPTPDGDVPRRDRRVLCRPGVDLDLVDTLVDAVADRGGPSMMPHYNRRTIHRPARGSTPDLTGTPALLARRKRRVPADMVGV